MSDNRTTELLPCPFCGGEADEYEGDYGNGIYCMRCGAMVGEPIHLEYMTTKRVSIAEAIAAWNTRADYHGYEQAAIEAWESIKAWNARAERTCEYAIKDNMNETEGMGDVWIECSACHCVFDYADEWLMNMHYCPNCGAKVRDA